MRSVYTQYTVYPPFFSLQLCFLRPPFIGCLVGRFMLIGVNLRRDGLTGGVSPASNCFGSSVCQRQSAYHQKLVFRCGEMAVFKHAYDVSLT